MSEDYPIIGAGRVPDHERAVPGRPDGRVEAYHINRGAKTICDQCFLDRKEGWDKQYTYPDVIFVSGDDSPYGDGLEHRFCIGHAMALMPGLVIVDPNDNFRVTDPAKGISWFEPKKG